MALCCMTSEIAPVVLPLLARELQQQLANSAWARMMPLGVAYSPSMLMLTVLPQQRLADALPWRHQHLQ